MSWAHADLSHLSKLIRSIKVIRLLPKIPSGTNQKLASYCDFDSYWDCSSHVFCSTFY